MTTTVSNPPIVLIAGHWLGAWAWDAVLERLQAESALAVALTLPGLDPADLERAARTLDDQADEILSAMADFGTEPAVLVAHSGANAPVSLVMDRYPEGVRRVIWVDSGPVAPGTVFAPDLPEEVEELPLPPFEALAQQASLDGLNADVLATFRARAVPEPGPVLRQAIELTGDARRHIPTTMVCCSLPGAQVRELAQSGHPMFAEVAHLIHLEIIDLPAGHWPMWSTPSELAQIIQSAASRTN